MDSLIEIRNRLNKFRDERGWLKYHTPSELARAIGIEAAELNELFLWEQNADMTDVETELADIFIYVLNFANVTGIDIIAAANAKIDANEIKHPIGKEF
jgi:NTP pyrophosphatase (non-canonical NTP hydrolase)